MNFCYSFYSFVYQILSILRSTPSSQLFFKIPFLISIHILHSICWSSPLHVFLGGILTILFYFILCYVILCKEPVFPKSTARQYITFSLFSHNIFYFPDHLYRIVCFHVKCISLSFISSCCHTDLFVCPCTNTSLL